MTDSDSYFPPDLLIEILLRLPVKSLIRFTVVSKSWHSLITSFSFISTHLAQTPPSNTLLVRRYVHTRNKKSTMRCFKTFITLPLPSIRPQSPHMFVLGFGADLPEKDDYKLVRLVYHKNAHGFMWSQAFLNELAVWIAFDVVANGGIRSLIMSFSIADEVFGEIMLPDALVGEIATELSIMLFEESLAVVKYEREIDGGSCEVWVMKHYGVLESWSRLYRINLVADMEKVVGFRSNGEVLFSTKSSELVSYDPNSGHKMDLGIHGSSRSFYIQVHGIT
ncbi:hypothetical protein HAX54_005330 [Datura stramonium]|uniref:F-box domain-containing protein n=1 Tax=Datura stramonium TaxID=4076 RepID=A0ABS8TAW4_DATST|nr:hypothetical protein [Datura stramonium]